MPSVVSEIKQWAKQLPFWEQAALDRTLTGRQFSETDYNDILQYLLEDSGLAVAKSPRPQFKVLNTTTGEYEADVKLARLEKIFNMNNINALVPGQTLTFCPTLTAVFGANGSGKSGYARVLGCAGFTRGDKQVFQDLTKPYDDNVVLSADIEIFDGSSTRIINYCVGTQCPELAQCYVFDSTSVRVHLTESNAFSFSPAGLSYLTQFAEVTDNVRHRLNMLIEQHNQPHAFLSLFQGESSITKVISELGTNTDLIELSGLATITSENENKIRELDKEIATLKARDILKEIEKISQTIKDFSTLKQKILSAERALNDEAITTVKDAVDQYQQRESMAQRLSADQFKTDRFTQIGTEAWHHFIESAKELAEAEGSEDIPYPQVDDYCLLCHQPLSREAYELLTRLWEYLKGDAQAQLAQSEKVVIGLRRINDSLDLDFFTDQSVYYRELQEHNNILVPKIIAFVDSCRLRHFLIDQLINTRQSITFPPLSDDCVVDMDNLVSNLETQRHQLEAQNPAERIESLSQELLTLQHRVILQKHIDEIKDYVAKRQWAQRACNIGGDTKHITGKHKQLFNNLVTDRYLELFTKILKELQRTLSVKVRTTGRKGKTYKQIVLRMDESAPSEIATPDKILSEGEKRAVALADFLTEVALDTTSRAIILDDPVTSLDLEWREMIASILANEATNRQVIVFTHDLPFLYFLKKHAESNSIPIMTHWVQRINDKPGYVALNSSPALERDYRRPIKPREYHKKALDSSGSERSDFLRLGFDALRTCYEAFVIYDLFEEVVMRFDERISFGRLKGIKWDDAIVNEANDKYELLSKYIGGHLHTDGYLPQDDPKVLLQEIEAFENLRQRLKLLKKT
jgi:hypothetical protein